MSRIYTVDLQPVELTDLVRFCFLRNPEGPDIVSRTRYKIRGQELDGNGDPIGEESVIYENRNLQIPLPQNVQSAVIDLVNVEIIPAINEHEQL